MKESQCPGANPVILMRKHGAIINLCTNSDLFPLPRIDDLLDKFSKPRYFTILNVAARYRQICMKMSGENRMLYFIKHNNDMHAFAAVQKLAIGCLAFELYIKIKI